VKSNFTFYIQNKMFILNVDSNYRYINQKMCLSSFYLISFFLLKKVNVGRMSIKVGIKINRLNRICNQPVLYFTAPCTRLLTPPHPHPHPLIWRISFGSINTANNNNKLQVKFPCMKTHHYPFTRSPYFRGEATAFGKSQLKKLNKS